jgi:hypothetical protein
MAPNKVDLDIEDKVFQDQVAAIEKEWQTPRQAHIKRSAA